jgi:hypothetical protein
MPLEIVPCCGTDRGPCTNGGTFKRRRGNQIRCRPCAKTQNVCSSNRFNRDEQARRREHRRRDADGVLPPTEEGRVFNGSRRESLLELAKSLKTSTLYLPEQEKP